MWRRENRARNRQSLTLPTGEFHPAFADEGFVFVRQLRDELVGIGPSRGIFDLSVRCGVPPVSNVFAHRTVEEKDLLLHDREQTSIRLQAKVANVRAIDQNLSGSGIMKTRDQVCHGGFTRAAAADERYD